MPLEIIRNDITNMKVDAIVNAANTTLLGGGGVDGAIHKGAGPKLLEECKTLGGCMTGMAKITKGYNLPSSYVIHTVGPIWQGGKSGEEESLISCYKTSLELAKENHCTSVAFPIISAGVYGYPKAQAFRVAVNTIGQFLMENEMLVYIVVYGKDLVQISSNLFSNIEEYIDDNYVEDKAQLYERNRPQLQEIDKTEKLAEASEDDYGQLLKTHGTCVLEELTDGLDDVLSNLDESFSQRVLRLIDERGMTDAQCYKRANIDRRLFSKIRTNIDYRPSKPTAIAIAISLELNLDQTQNLLEKAGFTLSRSSKFDVIVQYFISQGNYNIFQINEALFAFDQSLLGA